jgi:hypothetical protein
VSSGRRASWGAITEGSWAAIRGSGQAVEASAAEKKKGTSKICNLRSLSTVKRITSVSMIKGGQKHSETTRISDNQKKRKENVEFYQKETSEARTLMMPSDQCSLAQPIRTRAFWMAF